MLLHGIHMDSFRLTLRVLTSSFTGAVSTLIDSMGHSLLLLWGPEYQGDFVRWGTTWDSFLDFCFSTAFALIGFMFPDSLRLVVS